VYGKDWGVLVSQISHHAHGETEKSTVPRTSVGKDWKVNCFKLLCEVRLGRQKSAKILKIFMLKRTWICGRGIFQCTDQAIARIDRIKPEEASDRTLDLLTDLFVT
jgi:hypothetical protein